MTNSQQSLPNNDVQADLWSPLEVNPSAGEELNQAWLRAHQCEVDISNQQNPIEIRSSASGYEESFNKSQKDNDSFDAFLKELDEPEPSSRPRLGIGKGN